MNVNFNTNSSEIVIPTSKKKVFLLFIVSAIFVAGGLWFIINPSAFEHSGMTFRPDWETETIGYITVAFFGVCFIVSIFMFFSNKPGLIINDDGIIISSRSSDNIIKWNIIEKFDIKYISRTRLIQVYIKNPEEYISHEQNWFKKRLLELNYKSSGSLMGISTNAMKCNFDELYQFLTNRLKEYKEEKIMN